MSDNYTIFFVDDVEINRRIAESAFGSSYGIEVFESGKACLERLSVKTPDLFLLDVDMPEMDGYALCRRIKAQADCAGVPVVFISGLDDLESRLTGYDAGGNDFIVKPYKVAEIKQKIEVLRRSAEEKALLRNQLDDSDQLSALVMSNLDEYAVLIKLLRALNLCRRPSDIADAALAMLKTYGLEGALQFRLPASELTIDHLGTASPLQASIIQHVRSLGSIAEFRDRTAFNFEHISVLINNMPIADPDLCGRLRDHLAIAIETANEKLSAMQTQQESAQSKDAIEHSLLQLNRTVKDFSRKYEDARYRGSEATRMMLSELDLEFSALGLQIEQEEQIKRIIESRTDQLIDIFDFGKETESALNGLSSQLQTKTPLPESTR